MITVVNQSTLVANDQAALMVRACWTQIRDHAAPKWRLAPMPVVYAATAAQAPPGSWVIVLLDDPDQANALGYHTVTKDDVIYGKVFCRPVFDNGGDALFRPLSVASVLSHEVLETFVDPFCNVWHDTLAGYSIAREAGDPVESDSYAILVGANSITVSNFVTEKWFDPFARHGSGGFDFLNRVTAPFQMTKGGYLIRMRDGRVDQKFGEHFPQWKRAGKEFALARTARRVQAAGEPTLLEKLVDTVS